MVLLLTQALAAQTVALALVKPSGQGSAFTPAGGFQYTGSGNPITVQRATGLQHRFWVTVPGGNRGNLYVTPWGGSHYTVLRAWSFTSNAVIAEVDCYTTGRAPAPGCALLTSGEAAAILNLGNPNYFMPIPSGNAFLGLHVYAQGFALVPGVNSLGLAATYGLDGRIGDI